jgi:hypothetical protein
MDIVREWILGHPYLMSPSELRELVVEDGVTDYVFAHPDMKIVFDRMDEIKDPVTGATVVVDKIMVAKRPF